ncbi:MAG: ATP-dependent 6-phosphofructokinase [Candidatus Euphemobacter frigidus]|nr:ATP-dependent 6-phosphofructokinase [Candidatus Euphemobacter frigidus]MDP8276046.1 ATP-dependent 6-phosphofructokinase [Candidatus Euphemobacter frigidus]
MLKKEDFRIKSLGRPSVVSPIKFSTIRGDGIVNFIEDNVTIPYCIKSDCDPSTRDFAFECAGPRKMIFFKPKEVTAGIMTCGGLCPGLNDAIRSIVMQLFYKYGVTKILGVQFGQKGLNPEFKHKLLKLTPDVVKDIHIQGGSILGTSRGRVDPEIMVDSLKRHGINALFCLGGDGTQKGLHEIYRVIKRRKLKIATIGIPKTIDNDISYNYRTFGVDTAITVARAAVRCAHSEAVSAYNAIGLVKVMGRRSGFIAALTTLAANDVNFCLIPEVPFKLQGEGGLLDALEKRLDRRHHCVIVAAEGAGQDLLKDEAAAATYDASGNIRLGDIGFFLKNTIIENFKERAIHIDLKYIDPSYMIRSVPANANDSMFAAELGRLAANAAMAGKTDMMIGYWQSYFTHVPLPLAISKRKQVDPEGALWREVLSTTGQPVLMI